MGILSLKNGGDRILLTLLSAQSGRYQRRLNAKSYSSQLCFCSVEHKAVSADLFICPENKCSRTLPLHARLALFPSNEELILPQGFCADAALTCGMRARDTLSFSSISDKSAMLCLTRSVPFGDRILEPMEVRVDFDSSVSLYQNLTEAFILTFFDYIFSEANEPFETLCQRRESECRQALLP